MSWEQSVYSSNASSVAYDPETQEMTITWSKSGRRSVYSGVPEDVAHACANAPSVGQYINSEIKPNYEHRYL